MEEQQCIFSDNQTLVEQADVLVFHYRDWKWQPMPSVRQAPVKTF